MNLIEIINVPLSKSEGHSILCDKHYNEVKSAQNNALTQIRHLTEGFKGDCQMCTGDKTNRIEFDPTPETFEIQVHFSNGECEQGWTASGQAGHLIYITNGEEIYNTMESLKRRGIKEMYIEAGYRIHIEE